ncbi:MAG: bifunctional aminoglycoside phosphotransferase/ATP-binding protein [Sulfuricaulis sp.]
MGDTLSPLIWALHQPACYDHPVQDIRLVETHISWVLLTGTYAYKIKKPVKLGFLDFSTLEKRRFYCQEELRLNRRLAAALYLDVVPITGTTSGPILKGPGAAIEYAVKMVQFPDDARLDRMLARGELGALHIDALARELAGFHGRILVAGDDSPHGDPEQVHEPVTQNFEQIRPRLDAQDRTPLRHLETWSEQSFAELRPTLAERKRQGFVRECHGDAHLANMVWLDGRAVLFDCLEFNENLRWIDTLSETAFLIMDLDDRGHPGLARRALNTYLEHAGDYNGLVLFRFYQAYRALVRAKVACIRAHQNGLATEEKQSTREEYLGYVHLAERYTRKTRTALILTHGLSGSGKTWLSQQLLEAFDVIRLRSDVERKRLHGLTPHQRSGSGVDRGIYTAEAGRRTYTHLRELTAAILRAGYPVIVDAAFLRHGQRDPFRALAEELHVPYVILDLHVPESVLRQRLQNRMREAPEASEAGPAVLDHQLASREPLTDDEKSHALVVDSETSKISALMLSLRARLGTAA